MTSDEIERLRAELVSKADELEMVTAQRDHARRIVCRLTKKTYRTLKETAILRRWDCFKENKR
jgi:chromosome segregation ATPase